MTKRILTVLAMVSIAAMMMLSSCTAAGVECGLIGKWEYSVNMYTETWEFTDDDKFVQIIEEVQDGVMTKEMYRGTIESVSGKSLTIVYSDEPTVDYVIEYSDLSGNSVKIDGYTFKKVQ